MPLDADVAPTLQPSLYKLKPSRFAEYRRGLLIRLGIAIPLLSAGLFYLMWHFDKERSAFRFLFVPVFIVWLVYRLLKDQERNWQNLAFEFQDGKLVRKLDKYPTVELVPSEVTAIVESPRGITVETNERPKKLFFLINCRITIPFAIGCYRGLLR
jgi:hypothetical protein